VAGRTRKKSARAFHAFVRTRLRPDAKVEFTELCRRAGDLRLPSTIPRYAKTRAGARRGMGQEGVDDREGGSIRSWAILKRVLGMDTIMVGFALRRRSRHSPNEKYDLTSFHKGTASWARTLPALAG